MKYGPDRNVGFSPIPAMSMLSHAAGSRFMQLMGGPMLSFMIGMQIYHQLRRKFGAIKQMYQKVVIGITLVTL